MASPWSPTSALKEGEWPFLDFVEATVESIYPLLSVGVFPSAAEELSLSLSEALSSGDEQAAAELSRRLSQLSVPVTVTVNSQAYPQASIRWGPITLFIYI